MKEKDEICHLGLQMKKSKENKKIYRKITKVVKKRMTELQFSSSSPGINSPVQQFNHSKTVVMKERDNAYNLVLIIYIYINRCLMINLVVLFFACFFLIAHMCLSLFLCVYFCFILNILNITVDFKIYPQKEAFSNNQFPDLCLIKIKTMWFCTLVVCSG